MEYLEYLSNWIKEKVKEANANGVVVGISGGIDSTLVGYLAKKAFPDNSLGVLMPINQERMDDLKDGLVVANYLNLDYRIIDLYIEYNSICNKTQVENKITKGNLQSRLRMATLYTLAQENNYLVLGTDNFDEYMLGYFTKWGDGACDLQPIINLHKSEVYDYAEKIGIPSSIILKKPTAGLWIDQFDEDELGFTYNDFEKYWNKELSDKSLVEKIEQQIQKTNHKRIEIQKPLRKEENV